MTCDALAREVAGGLDDRAHLHLVDLRVGDRRGGSRGGRASGWTRASASLRCATSLDGRRRASRATSAISSSVVGQELVQRRVEQADRDRQAVHRAEDALEVVALHRQDLRQRARAGRPRRRRGSSRAPRGCGPARRTCARCGRGRCPRRRSARATRGVVRRVGVGAHLQAAHLVDPAPSASRSRRRAGRSTTGTAPSMTSPVLPSMLITSPSRTMTSRPSTLDRERAGVVVDLQGAAAGDAAACPCRARRRPRARSCRRAR